jgi:hypothetical protein
LGVARDKGLSTVSAGFEPSKMATFSANIAAVVSFELFSEKSNPVIVT